MNMIGLILYDCVYLMKVNTYASLGGVVMNSPNLYTLVLYRGKLLAQILTPV